MSLQAGSGGSGSPGEWSPPLQAAYGLRYGSWRDAAGAVSVGHRHTLADLVLLIAVDGMSISRIADE